MPGTRSGREFLDIREDLNTFEHDTLQSAITFEQYYTRMLQFLRRIPYEEFTGHPVIEYQDTYCINDGLGLFYHCETAPCKINGYFYYYVFDFCVSQKEWLELLRFSEEEKLAHYLKWGRHNE